MSDNIDKQEIAILQDDVKTLHKMGYAQELSRRMHVFSNFAISFSIICILAGGITAFQVGFSAGGGFSIGVGWLLGGLYSMIVAVSMAQIASAYPTAGGLYHWSSILGGRGWGWATAWINLAGLIFVVASVDVGAYTLFINLILGNMLKVDISTWGPLQQAIGVGIILASQAIFNHFGIRLTTKLTDFSGYLIFAVAILLTSVMLYSVQNLDLSRLFTFVNNSGDAGGGVFPPSSNMLYVFALGLLLPLYTITGFDASAHISEETVNARVSVPKGMMNSVLWSWIFGYIMTASFVLAMPDLAAAAKDGGNVFFNLLGGLAVPDALKNLLYVGIVVANYLCGLAAVTSTSRMIFAFARDSGLPASKVLRHVDPKYRTPMPAIWTTAVLALAATLYSPAFAALAAGCAMFFYISYVMPVAVGFFAEGKTWNEFGPFRLGALSKPLAVISVTGVFILAYIGIQPPNDIVINYAVGLLVLLVVGWYGYARKHFPGPPIGEEIKKRQAEIAAEEKAVGGAIGS